METHILFFILAGVLIAILVGYSVWSARREKSRIFSNTFTTRPPSTPISQGEKTEIPSTLNSQAFNTVPESNIETASSEIIQAQQQEVQDNVSKIRISLQDQQTNEPLYHTNSVETQLEKEDTAQGVSQNIISLYVVAREGESFRGDMIVHNLESLGFRFGEYQIFHRHLDDSTSPILFSVANMMQPGVFDLTKIEQFSTVGLVFFMYLPSAGNDLVNLRLMIRTVESFAHSMNGYVLDEQRQLFDEIERQNYLLRVKS